MKNRIWKQMKKAGIVTVLAGAMLGGTIEPELTLGADFLPGQAPFIDQSVFWKDIESGQAELGIRIRGLNEWLSGRRFSEDKEKNEKWDDELQKIEDPSVEQEEEIEQELPEDDWQQEKEPEQELPEDDWQQEEEPEQELSKDEDDLQQEEKAEQELPVDKVVEGIGIEMEEGYEHVEQLASGETVQPEDEEQEKTGPLTPEGTSTGGENVGNEEEGEFEETQKLTLVTYISEYFVPETDSVPKNMAAQVDGVDLWLCGHEHIELSDTVTTPNGSKAYVSESGYYLNTVGLIDLNCTMDAEGSVHVDYNKTSVDYEAAQNYPKDASVTDVLDTNKAENETALNRVIGTSPVELDGVWEHIRIGQTNLGNVITDAYLLATGADIAFENAGGIRASVNAGTITYGDVINISPYGNYIVTKKLTGTQIREMLETSLEIRKNNIVANDSGEWDAWPNDSGSYLQVGGISVEYDMEKTQGSRVVSIKKDGKTLNENEFYTVAVNNYLAESSSFPQLAAAQEEGEFAACDEALIRFFEQGSDAIAVSAADQRMVKATDKGQDTPQVPDTNG